MSSGVVTGRVKRFDADQGFGFVVADGFNQDILLHVDVLRQFGQASIAVGAQVDVGVRLTKHGWRVSKVVRVGAADLPLVPEVRDLQHITSEQLADVPLQPARVKWFDADKGFGFAQVFGSGRDVFMHIEVLKCSGLDNLDTGEGIAARVLKGKRGLIAGSVSPWQAACHNRTKIA